jgi:hypothetical protein
VTLAGSTSTMRSVQAGMVRWAASTTAASTNGTVPLGRRGRPPWWRGAGRIEGHARERRARVWRGWYGRICVSSRGAVAAAATRGAAWGKLAAEDHRFRKA